MKFCVIEYNDSYVMCHGAGLDWDKARSLVMSKMYDDIDHGDKPRYLQNVNIFYLEADDLGLGIAYDFGNSKTTYYILAEPVR